jgi:hypothetical protein
LSGDVVQGSIPNQGCSDAENNDVMRRGGQLSTTPGPDTGTQTIEIDFFRTEDAPGIAGLFREVYGEGYPIRTYYLPDQLIEENAAGHIISSVARTQTGEVVGHDALVLLDPADKVYENAAGAVLPAFRGYRIFPRLFRHSIVDAAKHFGLETIIGEPVCSHPHVQKMCLELTAFPFYRDASCTNPQCKSLTSLLFIAMSWSSSIQI